MRDLEGRLKKAEDSRSQLLDANANLENKLGVAMSANDGKIRKVLQLAFDDADFYRKIVEAAALYNEAADESPANEGLVRLKL